MLMTTTAVTAAPAGSRRFILGLRTPRRTFRASYPQSPVDQPSGGRGGRGRRGRVLAARPARGVRSDVEPDARREGRLTADCSVSPWRVEPYCDSCRMKRPGARCASPGQRSTMRYMSGMPDRHVGRSRRIPESSHTTVDRFTVDRFSANLPSTSETVCQSTPITPHSCFFRSVPRTKRLMTSIWR